jgi:hypothetical protein
MNKFNAISSILTILSLTNYFGWTTIPWILIQVPATIVIAIWIWAIVVATIIVIKNNTK